MRREVIHFRLGDLMLGVGLLALALTAGRAAPGLGILAGLLGVTLALTAHRVRALGRAARDAGREASPREHAWAWVESACCAGTLMATAACGGAAIALALGVPLYAAAEATEVATGRSLLRGPAGLLVALVPAGLGLGSAVRMALVLGRAMWPPDDRTAAGEVGPSGE